jgi:hypothetical protein
MKGKMSKDKKVRRVFEYENFTRLLGLPSEYSSTRLFVVIPIEYSWKVGNVWINLKKKKKQSENRQPSDV